MSDPRYSTDEDVAKATSSVSGWMDALLRPFRALVSKQAQKAYLGTLLFIGTSLLMICVSTVAYLIFYFQFIPQIGLERIVHLQFGDGDPRGIASVDSQLVALQPYDVTVKLELPRTPTNLAAGNFMLDLTLFSHPSTSLYTGTNTSIAPITHSRRPAILTYSSPMVDTASRLSLMPLYLTGWQREAEKLEVQMMESIEFPRGWRNLPQTLRLEIGSHERMQVYSAKVEFKAKFTGLRWIMYKWRISSFFFFTFLFWSVSMISTSVVWIVLAALFSTSGGEGQNELSTKKERRGRTPIKEESDQESEDLSSDDRVGFIPDDRGGHRDKRIKPEDYQEEEPRLDDLAGQADDEGDDVEEERGAGPSHDVGTGTGLESAEARGLQRRRSRQIQEEADA